MGKGTSAKLDTIVNIEINSNPSNVVLNEPLLNVEWLELEYVRIVDLPDAGFPPKFVYLEIEGLQNRPRLTTNIIRDGTWVSTTHPPPSTHNFPLYFKLDQQGTGVVSGLEYPVKVLHGKQKSINFLVEEFARLSDFRIKLVGANNQPLTFAANTVAQFVWRAHYQGKRNLDQSEHIRLYSRLHN